MRATRGNKDGVTGGALIGVYSAVHNMPRNVKDKMKSLLKE